MIIIKLFFSPLTFTGYANTAAKDDDLSTPRFRLPEKDRNLTSDNGRAGARSAPDLEYDSHKSK